MKCALEFKDANYNTPIFCEACGMDIGLNPIKVNRKGNAFLYCCDDCAKLKKDKEV